MKVFLDGGYGKNKGVLITYLIIELPQHSCFMDSTILSDSEF